MSEPEKWGPYALCVTCMCHPDRHAPTCLLVRAERAEARISACEKACSMPLELIPTTLDAHRNVAEADGIRAEEAEAAFGRMGAQVIKLKAHVAKLREALTHARRGVGDSDLQWIDAALAETGDI